MILRQRSPSTLSFHPDPDSGMDDLDVLLIKRIETNPGISVKELVSTLTYYNKDDPSEEVSPNYAQIWYRVNSLSNEGFIVSRREPNKKAMLRRCYPP